MGDRDHVYSTTPNHSDLTDHTFCQYKTIESVKTQTHTNHTMGAARSVFVSAYLRADIEFCRYSLYTEYGLADVADNPNSLLPSHCVYISIWKKDQLIKFHKFYWIGNNKGHTIFLTHDNSLRLWVNSDWIISYSCRMWILRNCRQWHFIRSCANRHPKCNPQEAHRHLPA